MRNVGRLRETLWRLLDGSLACNIAEIIGVSLFSVNSNVIYRKKKKN